MSAGEGRDSTRRSAPSDAELDRAAPRAGGGREVRVGAFVLLGIVAFLSVLFLLTDPATFRGRYIVSTEVEDAAGIRRGDPVQMRGVNIGRVHRFELVPEGVSIALEIDGRWPIPSDSRARLAGADLLGGRTVEIVPGQSPTDLVAGDIMPGESASGIMDVADEMGGEVRVVLDRMRELLDETAIASIHGSIGELEELLGVLTAVTQEQRGELARISSSLGRSAGRVEELVEREEIDRSLARADSTLAQLQEAGGNLTRATGSLETILGRIESGEGTLGRLTSEDELYVALSETLEEVRGLVHDFRENPRRYIRFSIF